MKLYEIADEYQKVFEDLMSSGSFDLETIDNTLSPITKSFEDKAKNVVAYINNLNSDIEEIRNHEKNIISRRKSYEKEVDNYRNYLKVNMLKLNMTSLKCKFFDISIKNSIPKLVIEDELKLPSCYIKSKTITEIDNAKLKDDLKNGLTIEGASLLETNSITIHLK